MFFSKAAYKAVLKVFTWWVLHVCAWHEEERLRACDLKKQSEADEKSHTGVTTKPNSRWSEKSGTTRANDSSVLHSVAAAAAARFAVLSFGLAGDGVFFFLGGFLKSRVVTKRKKEQIFSLRSRLGVIHLLLDCAASLVI